MFKLPENEMLKILTEDIEISSNPFRNIAEKLGVSEEQVVNLLQENIENRIVRRFGALLYHRNAGYKVNGMMVLNVPDEKADMVGEKLSQKSYISHCYRRNRAENWEYNLYAMVHGLSEEDFLRKTAEIQKDAGDYPVNILRSIKEYKKTSLKIL